MEGKPKAIVIGVTGFSADLYGNEPVPEIIYWQRLLSLPTFQMFVYETSNKSFETMQTWIDEFVEMQINEKGEKKYFVEYCDWHKAKGCWNNETVYGELK